MTGLPTGLEPTVIGLGLGLLLRALRRAVETEVRRRRGESTATTFDRWIERTIVLGLAALVVAAAVSGWGFVWGGLAVAGLAVLAADVWRRHRREARALEPVPYDEQEILPDDPPRRSGRPLRIRRRNGEF